MSTQATNRPDALVFRVSAALVSLMLLSLGSLIGCGEDDEGGVDSAAVVNQLCQKACDRGEGDRCVVTEPFEGGFFALGFDSAEECVDAFAGTVAATGAQCQSGVEAAMCIAEGEDRGVAFPETCAASDNNDEPLDCDPEVDEGCVCTLDDDTDVTDDCIDGETSDGDACTCAFE